MAEKKKRTVEGQDGKHHWRAWNEGRQSTVVQVWLNKDKADGKPDGDWEMPKVLGLSGCVSQAILQTEK